MFKIQYFYGHCIVYSFKLFTVEMKQYNIENLNQYYINTQLLLYRQLSYKYRTAVAMVAKRALCERMKMQDTALATLNKTCTVSITFHGFYSTGSTSWFTYFSIDWIPSAISCLQQYHHHWASSTKHLTHSGQCTFRCGIHHHSVIFE